MKEKVKIINEFGDDFTDLQWDGPLDSDEEVEELLPFKTDLERKQGIKFSKNGIIKFIEEQLSKDSPHNSEDPKNAALWENALTEPGVNLYIKKGGSKLNKDQPYVRIESHFHQKFKMNRFIKTVYNPSHQKRWDDLLEEGEF